jgi:hypothetical protein
MEDWFEEVERKEAARWERAEEAGALLTVGQTIRVGPHEVEIVKTLADCTQTAVLFRAPREAMIHPDALSPPELFGGLHGTMTSDLQIAHFKPVLPHRKTVVLAWQPRPQALDEAITTAVPVDRGQTAAHDRSLADPPSPVECDGMRVSVADGAGGVVVGLVDIVIEPGDPDIPAFSLGGPPMGFLPYPRRGPGPEELWREWSPPLDSTKGWGGPTISTATAVAVFDQDAAAKAPPPLEPAWTTVAFPSRESLAALGSHGHGGPPATAQALTLRFDAPRPEDAGIEVTLAQLYLFRYAGGKRLVVPAPGEGETVDLTGMGFDWQGSRLELLCWRPRADSACSLCVRPPSPDAWPDIRVLAEGGSVSLWTRPQADGTLECGLPRIYDPLFRQSDTVELALRMVGHPIEPITLTVPLTTPSATSHVKS